MLLIAAYEVKLNDELPVVSAPLAAICSTKWRLYKDSICLADFKLQASTPRCRQPQRLLRAATGDRGPAPRTLKPTKTSPAEIHWE